MQEDAFSRLVRSRAGAQRAAAAQAKRKLKISGDREKRFRSVRQERPGCALPFSMWQSHTAAISHKTGIKTSLQVIKNRPNTGPLSTCITLSNLPLNFNPPLSSTLICSHPHDHNPSSRNRVRWREKMMKEKD